MFIVGDERAVQPVLGSGKTETVWMAERMAGKPAALGVE
jgi:hypothetical protein